MKGEALGGALHALHNLLNRPPPLPKAHQRLDAAVGRACQLWAGLLSVAAGNKKAPKSRSSVGTGTVAGIDSAGEMPIAAKKKGDETGKKRKINRSPAVPVILAGQMQEQMQGQMARSGPAGVRRAA